MSTDPAFTVEWTVPTEDDERGGDAPDASTPTESDASTTRATAATAESDSLAARETRELPPAPVLAARVDHLRSERDARERELDAVRERYETILAERNAEIRELRAQESVLQSFVRRLENLF